MKYAKIKGLEPARIILGVGLFGSQYPADEGVKALNYYVENGGNTIDTGNVYANWIPGSGRSSSEKFLGKFFKDNPGFRDKIILCTKGAHYDFADPDHTPRVNYDCIKHDVEDSRRNMGVDYIDLYWLHRDDSSHPVGPIMDALFEAQDAKKIGAYGASNWSCERIKAANDYAASCGREGFFGSQIQFSFVHTLDVSDKTTLYFNPKTDGQFYIDNNIDLFAYTSQAKGYITKTLGGIPFVGNMSKNYDCPTNRERAKRAAKIAQEIGGCTAEEIALAYMHTLPYNVLTIVGPRLLEQIQASMKAGDISLTAEQIEYLARDETPLER